MARGGRPAGGAGVSEIREPDCPRCGRAPRMVLSPEQAFCVYEDCATLTWNMTMTRAENEAARTIVDISGTNRVAGPGDVPQ